MDRKERIRALEGAFRDIKEKKISQRQAAKKWGIPKSTLADRVRGRIAMDRRSGPPPVLSNAEERKLVDWLTDMSHKGCHVSKVHLMKTVKQILDSNGRITPLKYKSPPNLPGSSWYHCFLKRNPDAKMLINRKVEHKKSKAATKVEHKKTKEATKVEFERWLAGFSRFLSDHGFLDKPLRIWSCGKQGFTLQPKTGKVLGPVNNSIKGTQISVMACINAGGGVVPPYYLYPMKVRRKTWNPLAGDVVGAGCYFSELGWMDSPAFSSWLENHFVNHIPPTRPVVLLYDGDDSHIDYRTFSVAEENQILLYRLLPNASQLVQLCETAVFSSLKKVWTEVVSEFTQDNPDTDVTKMTFAQVFGSAWQKSVNMKHIIDAYHKAALYPIKPPKTTGNGTTSQIILLNSVINGYHVYQIRPPDNLELEVRKEYKTGKDEYALMIYLPELAKIPQELHGVITNETRQLKLFQVAGLPMGHVPHILAEELYKCKFHLTAKVTCCVTGDPVQTVLPWSSIDETGDAAVLPASYHIYVDEENSSDVCSLIQAAADKINEKINITSCQTAVNVVES